MTLQDEDVIAPGYWHYIDISRYAESIRMASKVMNIIEAKTWRKFKNLHARMKASDDVLETARETIRDLMNCLAMFEAEMADLRGDQAGEKNGKRWADQEMEAAVNMRANGTSVSMIAAFLRRSPAAVATKISELTGVPRDQIELNGRIDGLFEGEVIDGVFRGTYTKEKSA